MVVITARTTPEQQLHRVRAFLDAGARWVLVSTWDVHERTRVRFLGNIYDSMNQERPPVRARVRVATASSGMRCRVSIWTTPRSGAG